MRPRGSAKIRSSITANKRLLVTLAILDEFAVISRKRASRSAWPRQFSDLVENRCLDNHRDVGRNGMRSFYKAASLRAFCAPKQVQKVATAAPSTPVQSKLLGWQFRSGWEIREEGGIVWITGEIIIKKNYISSVWTAVHSRRRSN